MLLSPNKVLSLVSVAGLALIGWATSYAQESEFEKATRAWSEPESQPVHRDLVKIFSRLPPFALTDQRGETVASHDLYGSVWLVNFVFTRCDDRCDAQTAVMKELHKGLKASDNWKHTRLVSITADPEHDNPDVLSRFANDQELDTSQWHLLTGSREAVGDLMRRGFNLPVTDSGTPLLQSDVIVLVDWEGRIRGYYEDFGEQGLRILRRDIARVTFERIVQPAEATDPEWLHDRMQSQLESASTFEVFHDFKFSDETTTSGISFRHKIVDDAASKYKAAHYDHGNGMAVADVDQDGLYDIYFTTQSGSNELWRNLGDGRFENITQKAGLNIVGPIGVSASFGDIDNDGDPDLYITNVRTGNMLFENDGKGYFKNISAESGTDLKAHSSGSTFFDFDRDGLLDLYVSNVGVYTTDEISSVSVYTDTGQVLTGEQYYVAYKDAFAGHLKEERTENSTLLKNIGNNRFEDVTRDVGLVDSSWTGDAVVIDGNNDGWPDLYVINMQGNDEYYENVEGKAFVSKGRELFPKTSWGAMGVASFDFDNDGDMDIYVTDMHSDMAEKNVDVAKEKLKNEKQYTESFLQTDGNSIFGNAFFRNDGEGRYSEISDQIGAENYWPWGLSTGDLNADGYEDVFIASSMNYPYRYGVNSVLLNDKGRGFLDSEFVLGVEPRKNGITATPWFEINCSGRDAGSNLCGDTRGRRVIWGSLGSRSSVIFDLDQDGDQDIVTLEMNQPPLVLISNLSDRKTINHVSIRLIGTTSNRSGIGAVVKVFAGDDVYTRMNHGKSGYLSQSDYPLYFGLGSHKEVDRIEVTWPSGKTQVIDRGIELNQTLDIEEPAG